MSRELARLLAPLARRIRLTAARAVVTLIDDAVKLQGAQVKLLADEVRDQVERFQQYGFTGVPLAGAEAIYLSLNGSRDQGVVIVVDDRRYRLVGLEAGEVAVYDDQGQKVHLTRSGIMVDGAGLPVTVTNTPLVTLDTPKVATTGDLEVAGNILAQGDISDHGGKSMAGMRQVFDGHDHNETQSVTSVPNQSMS